MKKCFLILFSVLSIYAQATINITQRPNEIEIFMTTESIDAVNDLAGFEIEAADSLNWYCLDTWCEGYFIFDFQKLSCQEGTNDMDCTLNFKVVESIYDEAKLEINSVLCVLKGLPKISIPATGDEVWDYVVNGRLKTMVDEVCIMGVYKEYSSKISKTVTFYSE